MLDLVKRMKQCGASEIASLLGKNKFQSFRRFCELKLGLVEFEYTPPMKRGNVMEPIIIGMFEEKHSTEVTGRQEEFTSGIFVAHLDGRCTIDGVEYLVEVKAPGSMAAKGFANKGEPEYYYMQMQLQMHLSGVHQCRFVWLDYDRWVVEDIVVHYDSTLCVGMLAKAIDRFGYVERGELPPEAEELTPEEECEPTDAIAKYLEIDATYKAAEKKRDKARTILELEIGKREKVVYKGLASVSYKNVKPKVTVQSKELLEHAGLLIEGFNPDKFKKVGEPVRSLRVYPKKKKK